jgi:hypothetical protein
MQNSRGATCSSRARSTYVLAYLKRCLLRSSNSEADVFCINKNTDGLQTSVLTVDFLGGGPAKLMRYRINLITYTQTDTVLSQATVSDGTVPTSSLCKTFFVERGSANKANCHRLL